MARLESRLFGPGTGSDDGTAKVWGFTDQGASEPMTLAAEEGVISGVAFSGDGTQVMTGSQTSAVKIWDVGPSGDAEWANVDNHGDVMFARAEGAYDELGVMAR